MILCSEGHYGINLEPNCNQISVTLGEKITTMEKWIQHYSIGLISKWYCYCYLSPCIDHMVPYNSYDTLTVWVFQPTGRWCFQQFHRIVPVAVNYWGQDKIDAILQTTFSNAFSWMENVWILLKISLKFVPKVWINNITALVQIMDWRRPGNEPLSEPVMVNFLMYIYASLCLSELKDMVEYVTRMI